MLSKIFFGGDVNQIGRNVTWQPNQKFFKEIPILSEADLRIINLNCVLATKGQQGIDKGETAPFYFHARPEEINLLTESKIDVVLNANNHAMDYCETALLEQNDYLDRAGILHCGTGKNLDEASRPLFIKVKDIVIALFNVDATMKFYAATENTPGTFYLPPDKPELWKNFFEEKIADAREKADVIFVAPHWYPNLGTELKKQIRSLGKLLIDCGADAVLGCHFSFKHGVETYRQRPIIYNTGNFLFDTSSGIGGGFSLEISKRGVEQIFFHPLPNTLSEERSQKIREQFLNSCRKLNTQATTLDNAIALKFEPPTRAEKILQPVELSSSRRGEIIPPMTEPLPDWTPDKVPDDAIIEPQKFGAVKLIGCRISPECLLIKTRQTIYVETWWTLDEPTDKDLTIRLLGVPAVKVAMPNFGAGMDHQACDSMWPTNRWKTGFIYREKFGIRPPSANELVNVDLFLQVSVLDDKTELGKYVHPTKIQMQIPNRPTVNLAKSFDEEFNIDDFKNEFKVNNGEMFFMLRAVKPKAPGIEQSAFRRAKLFRKYFGIDISFVTNEYQNDLLDNRDELGLDVRVYNMYDYFQEINRDVEKARKILVGPMKEGWSIERLERDWKVYRRDGKLIMYCIFSLKNQKLNYVNFFNDAGKKFQRDTYDMLGFLSRRQNLEPETSRVTESFYYRPDGSLAIHKTYELVDDKNTLISMELVNREGVVTNTFNNLEDALSHFLFNLLRDKKKNYFLIGDRTPEWNTAYVNIKTAGLNNVRVIHQVHSLHVVGDFNPLTAPTKGRYKYLTNKNLKVDAIVTCTKQQENDILQRYYVSNVCTIPHPLKHFEVGKVKFNPLLAVMVGRIAPEKGHSKVIDAFKIVTDKIPQAQLHFYGTGSLRTELQAKIDKLNLKNSIIFKGFSDNIGEIFSSAALSICASAFEGFSLAVQESLQNNCPVVSFDCHYGPRDMIKDGVNGYLVPIDDIEAMADRIIKIFAEPALQKKLAANCAKSVERFSEEVVARQWANLFYKLMNNQTFN